MEASQVLVATEAEAYVESIERIDVKEIGGYKWVFIIFLYVSKVNNVKIEVLSKCCNVSSNFTVNLSQDDIYIDGPRLVLTNIDAKISFKRPIDTITINHLEMECVDLWQLNLL